METLGLGRGGGSHLGTVPSILSAVLCPIPLIRPVSQPSLASRSSAGPGARRHRFDGFGSNDNLSDCRWRTDLTADWRRRCDHAPLRSAHAGPSRDIIGWSDQHRYKVDFAWPLGAIALGNWTRTQITFGTGAGKRNSPQDETLGGGLAATKSGQ